MGFAVKMQAFQKRWCSKYVIISLCEKVLGFFFFFVKQIIMGGEKELEDSQELERRHGKRARKGRLDLLK